MSEELEPVPQWMEDPRVQGALVTELSKVAWHLTPILEEFGAVFCRLVPGIHDDAAYQWGIERRARLREDPFGLDELDETEVSP